jgi:rhodanese-related sulfurtransferase
MTIEEVDTDAMLELVRDGAVLVDVREQEELENDGYIEGMIHMPLSEFDSFEEDIAKDKPIVFYCRSGKRSLKAAEIASDWTSEAIYSLRGGIIAYKQSQE